MIWQIYILFSQTNKIHEYFFSIFGKYKKIPTFGAFKRSGMISLRLWQK